MDAKMCLLNYRSAVEESKISAIKQFLWTLKHFSIIKFIDGLNIFACLLKKY